MGNSRSDATLSQLDDELIAHRHALAQVQTVKESLFADD